MYKIAMFFQLSIKKTTKNTKTLVWDETGSQGAE